MTRSPAATPKLTKPPQPLWRILLGAFWQGFSTPSRPGAMAMLLGLVVSVCFSLWFFSPQAISGRMGDYLPRSARDAEAFATVNAIRLGTNGVDRPTLIALGSSTIAQALSDGRFLRAEIAETMGQDWAFVSLTTPQQSPLDQLALMQTALSAQTTASPPVVVLLSASGQRMGWTPDRLLSDSFQNRIGLQSTWRDQELARLGQEPHRKTGIYAIDNYDFVCLNGTEALLRLVLARPARQSIASYAAGPVRTGADRAIPALRQRFLDGQDNTDLYLDRLTRFVGLMQARPNVRVVLIDEPYAPDALADLGLTAAYAQSTDTIRRFAQSIGVPYLTPMANADLGAQAYHDAFHLVPGPAQQQVQRQLGAALAPLLAEGTP